MVARLPEASLLSEVNPLTPGPDKHGRGAATVVRHQEVQGYVLTVLQGVHQVVRRYGHVLLVHPDVLPVDVRSVSQDDAVHFGKVVVYKSLRG